jgi:hypothetical protein
MKELKNIEPDFKNKPIEWVGWNMKTTGNSFETALILLKQRQILSSF